MECVHLGGYGPNRQSVAYEAMGAMRTIRYQFDEHIANAVAVGLRKGGIDVVTAAEVGLLGARNADALEYARSVSRVVVTSDADYLRPDAAGVSHAGIVFCVQDALSIGEMIETLDLIYRTISSEVIMGHVEFA